MKTTIIIKRGREEKKVKVGGYFLIASNPNKFKGIRFYSSELPKGSVPRMRGWVEWDRDWLKYAANLNFVQDRINAIKKSKK